MEEGWNQTSLIMEFQIWEQIKANLKTLQFISDNVYGIDKYYEERYSEVKKFVEKTIKQGDVVYDK